MGNRNFEIFHGHGHCSEWVKYCLSCDRGYIVLTVCLLYQYNFFYVLVFFIQGPICTQKRYLYGVYNNLKLKFILLSFVASVAKYDLLVLFTFRNDTNYSIGSDLYLLFVYHKNSNFNSWNRWKFWDTLCQALFYFWKSTIFVPQYCYQWILFKAVQKIRKNLGLL